MDKPIMPFYKIINNWDLGKETLASEDVSALAMQLRDSLDEGQYSCEEAQHLGVYFAYHLSIKERISIGEELRSENYGSQTSAFIAGMWTYENHLEKIA